MAVKNLEKLRTELGRIDKIRREIFELLREDPQNIILYTEQTLKAMVDQKTWFEKQTSKGSVYTQLISFNVVTKATTHLANERKPIVEANLSWNQVSEESTSIIESKVSISTFNEIEPQILNGFKRTILLEKEIQIKTLDLKEKALLEQIKQLKEQRKKIK